MRQRLDWYMLVNTFVSKVTEKATFRQLLNVPMWVLEKLLFCKTSSQRKPCTNLPALNSFNLCNVGRLLICSNSTVCVWVLVFLTPQLLRGGISFVFSCANQVQFPKNLPAHHHILFKWKNFSTNRCFYALSSRFCRLSFALTCFPSVFCSSLWQDRPMRDT